LSTPLAPKIMGCAASLHHREKEEAYVARPTFPAEQSHLVEVIRRNALFDWLEKIFPEPETGYEGDNDRDDECRALPQHLTRQR
jgi:hypothetical protein